MVLIKDSYTGFSGQKGFGGSDSSVANLSNIQKNFINQVDAKREAGMGISAGEEKKYKKFKEKQNQNISSATTTDTSGVTRPTEVASLQGTINFIKNPKAFLQKQVDKGLDSMTESGKTMFGTDIGGSAVGEDGLGRFGSKDDLQSSIRTGDQFSPVVSDTDMSPSLGATEGSLLASANIGTDDGFNQFIQKDFGITTDSSTYKSFPGNIKFDLKNQYEDSLKFKEGTQINQAPVKEKTIGERVADFTGNVVNTLTGTQSAVAQTKETGKGLFGGSVPEGTYSQFSPTTKSQYQTNREENRPFSSKNLDASKTPFGSVNLRASEKPTTVKTESNVGGTVVTPADTSALNVKSFANRGKVDTGDTSFSAYVRAGGEGQERGVTTPKSTGAPRQTVASLPSNYKSTEAEAFRKAAAFKEAQGIAKRNPNVSVGVDSKGQPKATAANNSGVARAQAAAVNRKISGKSISQTKAANQASMRQRASERNKAFQAAKKAGTLSKSARTAAGQRARNKAAAKARAKAAAKARNKAKNRNRRGGAGRRSGGRRRRCDIFLKHNISPLTNMNLIRDDLAEVAYFVKEIQK